MVNPWFGSVRVGGGKERNDILQKAVLHYLANTTKENSCYYPDAAVSYSTMKGPGNDGRGRMGRSDDGSAASQLKQFAVTLLPKDRIWLSMKSGTKVMLVNEKQPI